MTPQQWLRHDSERAAETGGDSAARVEAAKIVDDMLAALEAIENDASDASEPSGLTIWIAATARAAIARAKGAA